MLPFLSLRIGGALRELDDEEVRNSEDPKLPKDPASPPPPGLTFIAPNTSLEGKEYREALYSENVKLIANLIEADQILSSTEQFPLLCATLSPGRYGATRNWWIGWQKTVQQKLIGQGSYNVAFLVKPENMPEARFFKYFYNQPPPELGLVVRRSKQKGVSKSDVVREFITGFYAQMHGIGPKVYAAFFAKNDSGVDQTLPWDQDATVAPPTESAVPPSLKTFAGLVVAVSEAWEGDLTSRLGPPGDPESLDPVEFAAEFVKLCTRAADCGLFHFDFKAQNALYRTDRGRLELCMTDFDPYFVKIRGPEVWESGKTCLVVATAAMFLGQLTCSRSKEVASQYSSAVLSEFFNVGIDVQGIEPTEWCFFLRDMNESRIVRDSITNKRKVISGEDLSDEELILGKKFRGHVENYLLDDYDEEDECFTFEEGKPLFAQILDYLFADLV